MFRPNMRNMRSKVLGASYKTPYPGNRNAGYAETYGDYDILQTDYSEEDPRFYDNLAFYLSDSELQTIGAELSEAIKADDDSRQKSLRLSRDTIDFMGIGQDRPKQRPSNDTGSTGSQVFGPTLLKLTLQNTAKFHSNLFPAKGLVDFEIHGDLDEVLQEQSERMQPFANFMLLDVMRGFIEEKKQALYWMNIEGQVFFKPDLDRLKGIPASSYIRSSDVIINPGASSIGNSERTTYRSVVSKRVADERMRRGEWLRVRLEDYDLNQNIVKQKADIKMGQENISSDRNKMHSIDECMCYLDLNGFRRLNKNYDPSGIMLPYLVLKDSESDKIVGIWRNYSQFDRLFLKKERLIQYKYFTADGPYGFGLSHILLGLAKAETNILQQLILSGEFSNNPGYYQLNNLKSEKSQMYSLPGTVNQVTAFGANSIQDVITPIPTKEPSQTLLNILTSIISPSMSDLTAAANFSFDKLPPNAGQLLVAAIVSTSCILEDSVMRGLYDSFTNELKLLFNIFEEWLPESPYPFNVSGGSYHIVKEDFTPNLRLKPTVDPNASSGLQQMVIADAVYNLASSNPDLYDMHEVNKFYLKSIKVNDIERILLPKEKDVPIPELDFVSENARVQRGEPIQVYPTQDHASHIIGHDDYLQKLTEDTSTDNSEKIAALTSHSSDHKAYEYLANIQAMMGKQIPQDVADLPEDIQNKISVLAAKAIQKQQAQQAKNNPPPLDPNVVLREEIHMKAEKNKQDFELNQYKSQSEMQKVQSNHQISLAELEIKKEDLAIRKEELEIKRQELMIKAQDNSEKNQTNREKIAIESQNKSYESTLRYETEKDSEIAENESEKYKTDLEAQSKAYDTTLNYEKEEKGEEL